MSTGPHEGQQGGVVLEFRPRRPAPRPAPRHQQERERWTRERAAAVARGDVARARVYDGLLRLFHPKPRWEE